MKVKLKVLVSLFLCFLLILGQLPPGLAVQAADSGTESLVFEPSEYSVFEDVYGSPTPIPTSIPTPIPTPTISPTPQNPVISGLVELPSGYVAPSGGLSVTVYAIDGKTSKYSSVKIAAGQNSAAYSITVPRNEATSGYRVKYSTSYDVYASEGFYSSGGTVKDSELSDLIDVSSTSKDDINLTLIPNKKISGTVSLPEGVAPEGGVDVSLYATNGKSSTNKKAFKIEAGKSSVAYTLYIGEVSGYAVKYETKNNEYTASGFYNEEGENDTVRIISTATKLNTTSSDLDGINFALIPKKVISGNILHPNGPAPTGGVTVKITAECGSDKITETLNFDEGLSSLPYTLKVPPNSKGTGYTISCTTPNDIKYLSPAYYQSGEPYLVRSETLATLIDVSSESEENLDLPLAPKRIISGTISLPEGNSPDGGIGIKINAVYGSDKASTDVTIPADSNSAEYTLYVPEGSAYTVSYSIKNEAYVDVGYYNNLDTVSESNAATTVDTVSGDQHGKNMMLIAKRRVEGTVYLPSGKAPAGGLNVDVHVSNGTKKIGSKSIIIDEGEDSVSYYVYVPTGSGYNVRYEVINNLYVKTAYYNNNSMVRNLSSATLINVDTDRPGINLTIMENRTISGVLSMPSGVAPVDGISFKVSTSSGSDKAETTVTIPEGDDSVPYELNVPSNDGYIVKVELLTLDAIYMNTQYYSDGGTVYNLDSAHPVSTSSESQTDINIGLLEKRTVTGTISLPPGMPESYEGWIFTFDIDKRITEVIIEPGKSSANYKLYFNPGKYNIGYECGKDSVFVSPGYYSTGGTVTDKTKAALVDVTEGNQPGINIVLLLKKTISGKIMLSTGKAPEKGYTITLKASNGIDTTSSNFTIYEDEQSRDYTLYVPPGDKYKVWYEISKDYDYNFVSPMYYNSDGMVRDSNSSSLMDLRTDNKTNIDLTLIEKRIIRGNVLLPSGIAPSGGMNLKVKASNGKDTDEVSVSIPEGAGSAEYQLLVPAGKDYKVQYTLDAGGDYASGGYHGVGGTTLNVSAAALLDTTVGNKNNINLTLIQNRIISGKLSLPSGAKASSKLSVKVYASKDHFVNVDIPSGNNSASYTLKVPPNVEGSGYKVYYTMSANANYLSTGYYMNAGMTKDEASADLVDVSSSNKEINLMLISKSSISGVISLPKGTAPQGGISVTVNANNGKDSGSIKVIIAEGTASIPYTINVPAGTDYKIKYNVANTAYIKEGYYSGSATTRDATKASSVDVGNEGKTDIDLELIAKSKIEGTITLPKVAPAGGLKVTIRAINDAENENVQVIVPQAVKSIPYTLYVPAGSDYKVQYEITDKSYMPLGYYGNLVTTLEESAAKPVDATNDIDSININPIAKRAIAGYVKLQSGVAPAGGIEVTVNAVADKSIMDSAKITIAEGLNTSPYTLYVPSGETVVIQYTTINTSFISPGYYSQSGTTELDGSATPLKLTGDLESINMTLLPKSIISGTIFIPEGVAPISGIDVNLTASNSSGSISFKLTIPEGHNSVPYTIYVPSEDGYTLKYNTSAEKYVAEGYYSINGTTRDVSKASRLSTKTSNQVGINVGLIPKKIISGRISIPKGIAPFGGIKLKLEASNGKDSGSTNIVISEVSSSASYELYVPAGSDYLLSYKITNPDGKYLYPGYYNLVESERDKENATLLDLSEKDALGTNMTLIENRLVSGAITLPSGTAPTGGLTISITASNDRDIIKTSVVMTQKSSSANYKLYLPEGSDYIIGYTINHENYLSGFYNTNGTVLAKDEASTFNVAKENISGLNIQMIAKRIISGTVSLPNGDLAPSGGISVKVFTGSYSTNVTIPQGESSVAYTLRTSPNKSDSGYIVQYTLSSSSKYALNGYYSTETTVAGSQTASPVDVSSSDASNIDMTIIDKRIINGKIKLQSGKAPEGGIKVTISADGTKFSTDVTIPYGTSIAEYDLKLDPNKFGNGYKVKYSVDSKYGYVSTGYHSVNGTVLANKEATPVDVYYVNQNIGELLIMSNNYIKGTMSLPLAGASAPNGGMPVSIIAENTINKTSNSVDVTIPEGEKSVEYVLNLPPGSNYKLYYKTINNKYVECGYYSTSGTVSDPAKTELLSVSGNIEGKDLCLISKKSISGQVLMPFEMQAPASGIQIEVIAENKVFKDSVFVTIPGNNESKNYTLLMPPASDYKLYYKLSSSEQYVNQGYFSNVDTKLEQNEATLIDISVNDKPDADITLIKNSTIGGSILLPTGSTAPNGGIDVTISATSGKCSNKVNVLIPEGESFIDYSLAVPPTSGYSVSYKVSSDLDYVTTGYYNIVETTIDKRQASPIDLTFDDNKSINFTLIHYNSISGNISLPEGNAPSGGITVTVFAQNSSKNIRETTVTIPESKSSAEFNIYVPDGTGYKVSYVMAPNAKYADKGFFTPSGTVLDENSCVPLDIIGASSPDTNITLIAKRIISGTLSLPDGEKAPSGGITVEISAIDGDTKTVTIPAGSSSVEYSLNVLPNTVGFGYRVKFETVKNYNYINYGYYSAYGCVREERNAHPVDVSIGNAENIDLLISKHRTIEGSISVPGGVAPEAGITLSIIASNNIDSAETSVFIPGGSDHATYKLSIPPNDGNNPYKVRYENWLNNSFVTVGYYSTEDGMVKNSSMASDVNVREENKKNVNLTLIGKKVVSGTISLPNGDTAPTGGLTVTITVKNDDDATATTVTIPKGENSREYSINVPVGKNYMIGYGITTKNDYVTWGYYNSSGMTYMPDDAELINIGSENISEIDLTLLTKKTISGTVSLPGGNMAPSGGLKVEIYAEDAGDAWVTIPSGENSIEYAMKVLPNIEGKGYKVNYRISSEYDFVNYGYYHQDGTVRNSKLAQPVIANNSDVSDIDIKIMRPKAIEGTVQLPEGMKAPQGGITINIAVFNETDGASTEVKIPYNQSSVEYSISLPPNDPGYGYKVRYENWSNTLYTTYGYHGDTETTVNISYAKLVDIHTADASGIDMTLLRKKTVNGKVKVPDSYIVPPEGLNLMVFVSNGTETYSTIITIPYSKTEANYSVHVESGSGYRLYYFAEYNEDLMMYGYYSNSGVVTDLDKAKVFKVDEENITGMNLSLLEKRTLSGTISVSDTASETDGIEIIVSASNDLNVSSTSIVIPKGETSAAYTLNLPAGADYILKYETAPLKGFAPFGYYSRDGMVRSNENAEPLDLSTDNLEVMDMMLIENMSISGKIELPLGFAPENGIEVTVTARDNTSSTSDIVLIAEGERSVEYTLSVPPNVIGSGYKVSYSTTSEEYGALGYYSTAGTVPLSENASAVDVSSESVENINLVLINKKTIKGKISLPDGMTAGEGGLYVSVQAISESISMDDSVSVLIPEGSNSAEYSVKVSTNAEGTSYRISYRVSEGHGLLTEGYYNISSTVPDIKVASAVDVRNGDYSNADMELIKSRKISGTVSLPNDGKAPIGGVGVTVFALKNEYTGYKATADVLISEGKNSAKYEMYVPESISKVTALKLDAFTNNSTTDPVDDYSITSDVFIPLSASTANSDYILGYTLKTGSSYCTNGYYSPDKTVTSDTKAQPVSVEDGDISVDISLIPNERSISGTITLPAGKTAPSGGITITVEAINNYLGYVPQKTVTIAQNKSSVSYEIPVPVALDDYFIKYTLKSSKEYVSSGFYGEDGIKGTIEKSTPVDVSKDNKSSIDLKLISGIALSGNVHLPSGQTAGNSDINLVIKAANENHEVSTNVIIGKGGTSTSYVLNVPTGSKYVVSYSVQSLFGEYVKTGYYNTGATTPNAESALELDIVTSKNAINLTLLPTGRTISGTVSLHDGTAAVPYTINVPANLKNSGYKLSYTVESGNPEDTYKNKAYYSKNGTTSDIDSASLINVNARNSLDISMSLLKGTDMIALEGMRLDKSSIAIQSGMSTLLDVEFIPENASNKTVKWTSSNTNIAVVSSDGTVTAVSPGTAVVTATASNSLTIFCTISVLPSNEAVLSIDKTSININKGKTEQLTAIYTLQSENDSIIWVSDNTDIATVTEDGLVTAVASGTANITASSSDDESVKSVCKVTVNVPVTKLVLDKTTLTLKSGESERLLAEITPNDATAKGIIWTSDDESIAKVSQTGDVTGAKAGTTKVTARSSYNSSITSVCTVEVKPVPVEKVLLERNSLSLYPDEIYNFKLTVTPENAIDTSVKWESSNPDVATVSPYGIVNSHSTGTAVITVTSQYDTSIKFTCTVAVNPRPVTSVTIKTKSETILVGASKKLAVDVKPFDATNKKVTWSSSNSSVATVSQDGTVNGIKEGTVIISAASESNSEIKGECTVKIEPIHVTSIAFSTSSYTIGIGTTKLLTIILFPANATNKGITWSSSNTSVATVSSDGLVTGKITGSAVITATSNDGNKTAQCTISVQDVKVTSVRLNKTSANMYIGEKLELKASVLPDTSSNKDVSWSSSNDDIATVSSDGSVRARKAGKATITATSKDGSKKSASCSITVSLIGSVSINRSFIEIEVNEAYKLTASITPSNAPDKRVTWKSSNESVATVSSSGEVKGKKKGSAEITVTCVADKTITDICYVDVVTPSGAGGAIGGGGFPVFPDEGTPTPTPTSLYTPTPTATPIAVISTPVSTSRPSDTVISEFNDVTNHWAKENFKILLEKKIISGYPDKTLKPDLDITRAEAMVMVIKAGGFNLITGAEPNCSDNSAVPDWAKSFVATGISNKIVSGYEDGSFRPSNKITRSEMVIMILNSFKIAPSTDKALSFADSDKVPDWAKGYVKKAVDLGIVKGYNDNTFGPQKEITRAEATTIIAKCMELQNK